jgi:hypothetical protein
MIWITPPYIIDCLQDSTRGGRNVVDNEWSKEVVMIVVVVCYCWQTVEFRNDKEISENKKSTKEHEESHADAKEDPRAHGKAELEGELYSREPFIEP